MGKEDKQMARLLNIMREQGKKDNPETLVLGTMTSSDSCMIGDLPLDSEDLLIAEYLTTGYHKAVSGSNPSLKNEDTFIKPLKKGDQVVLMKIEEQDVYVILCKVVEL